MIKNSSLYKDLKRYNSKKVLLKAFFRAPNIWIIVSYRIGRALKRYKLLKPIELFWAQFIHFPLQVILGIELSLNAEFGPGLKIHHRGGIVINSKVKAGSNVTLYNGITIGNNFGEEVPTIGNNVIITTGAKIIGNIVVGDNSIIGANSVVIKNVPRNTVVAGVPARIIKENINIKTYIDKI